MTYTLKRVERYSLGDLRFSRGFAEDMTLCLWGIASAISKACINLSVKALPPFEPSETTRPTTQRYVPEDVNLLIQSACLAFFKKQKQ